MFWTALLPQLKAADLFDAIRSGDAEAAKALLDAGADVNAAGALGATPLHDAVWNGRADLVTLLLDRKADVNARHLEAGSTPLQYAAIKNDAALAALLLEGGADVRLPSKSGATALNGREQ